MVTFKEDMSYAEALELGKIQDSIMNEMMQKPEVRENPDNLDFEKIIQKYRKLRS